MNIWLWKLVVVTAVGIMAVSSSARAVPFDKLAGAGTQPQEQQSLTAFGPVSATSSTVQNAPGIIGGTRFLQTSVNGGSVVRTDILGGALYHSQNSSTKGSTFVVWDGNPAANIQTTGLGAVDLTSDDATAVKVVVDGFDFAFNNPLKLIFKIYDATDATGTQKVSMGSVTLNQVISAPTTILIPFSSFVKDDTAAGPASFKTVGAITFLMDGSLYTDFDLSISFIGTDGRCNHIPINGLIVDECGVCNGDNSTCSDCEGTPNGTKIAGTYCPTGELGTCGDGTYSGQFPTCQCNRTNGPLTELCNEVDDDCDGSIDEGFSKGNTCSAGVGACLAVGSVQCAGGGVICTAQPGLPSEETCDGIDNDCDGETDEGNPTTGSRLDQCGVCNGDGKSCIDCNGVVKGSATIDSCGVCGGDDSSCITCDSIDMTAKLNALDGGAKEQEILIVKAIGSLKTVPNAKKHARFISSTIGTAHRLQLRNWILSWSLPQISTTCQTTSTLCTTSSNLGVLGEYRANNAALKNLALQVLSKVKAGKKNKLSRRDKQLYKLVEKQYQANLSLSNTVPEVQYSCLVRIAA